MRNMETPRPRASHFIIISSMLSARELSLSPLSCADLDEAFELFIIYHHCTAVDGNKRRVYANKMSFILKLLATYTRALHGRVILTGKHKIS